MAYHSMNQPLKSEHEIRLEKLGQLKKRSINPYPDRFAATHSLSQALKEKIGTGHVIVAGRIVTQRRLGKIVFLHLLDDTAKMQIVIQENILGPEPFALFCELIAQL